MPINWGDEVPWKNDDSWSEHIEFNMRKRGFPKVKILSEDEILELDIATDLKIYSLDKVTPTPLARAKSIYHYVDWIIDDKRDTAVKLISGLLTQKYKRSLLAVLEREAVPYLISKHKQAGGLGGMNRVEFWLLQDAIERLKQQL